jgi:hypothetical protein
MIKIYYIWYVKLIAATGSCDAGGSGGGHGRSLAAEVRVVTSLDLGLTSCPVRRRCLTVDLKAVAALKARVYRTADRSYFTERAGGPRAAMAVDFAKNLLRSRLTTCPPPHAKTCQLGTVGSATARGSHHGLTHRRHRVL